MNGDLEIETDSEHISLGAPKIWIKHCMNTSHYIFKLSIDSMDTRLSSPITMGLHIHGLNSFVQQQFLTAQTASDESHLEPAPKTADSSIYNHGSSEHPLYP